VVTAVFEAAGPLGVTFGPDEHRRLRVKVRAIVMISEACSAVPFSV
jgi:hypothetical protein